MAPTSDSGTGSDICKDSGRRQTEKSPSTSLDQNDDIDNSTTGGRSTNEDHANRGSSESRNIDEGEGSDGDLSDGIDVNDNSFRDRWKSLKERIKVAPKRLKQHHQYIHMLEDRITLLEDRWDDYVRRTSKEPLEETQVVPEAPIIAPNLNPQFWQEFEKADQGKDKYCIDVLLGEPQMTALPLRKSAFRRERPIAANLGLQDQGNPSKYFEEVLGTQVPEIIRINSFALKLILARTQNPKKSGSPGSVLYLRPYKYFVRNEQGITDKIRDLRETLEEFRNNNEREAQAINTIDTGPATEQCPPSGEEAGRKSEGSIPVPDKNFWTSSLELHDLYCCDSCTDLLAGEWKNVDVAITTMDSLLSFMKDCVAPVSRRFRDRSAGKLRFWELWYLFQPGDNIVTRRMKRTEDGGLWYPLGMRVLRTKGGRYHLMKEFPAPLVDKGAYSSLDPDPRPAPINGINPFWVDAYYLDYNGSMITPVTRHFIIWPYAGERDITDLDIIPAEYVREDDMKWTTLIGRGHKFVNFARASSVIHKECKGSDLNTREEVNGQVIVDMREYFEHHETISLPSFHEPMEADYSETCDCPLGQDCPYPAETCHHRLMPIMHDQEYDKAMMEEHVSAQTIFEINTENPHGSSIRLVEDDYAICNYRLYAYMLRARQWVQICVDDLSEVTRIDTEMGFELLVLPKSHKHIIQSQVQEHLRKKRSRMVFSEGEGEVDLVRGKGKGLIILLHGAPGVGKTCTAECIADLVKKPLFPITCGDLGTNANEVESNLNKHFKLASKWDCVMLLDEADVFLAKRRQEDYRRNSIVSVFLRMMEYYTGILFLTTNRVGTFDEAFKSRVHISLFYPEFDQETTVDVWKTFIKQTKKNMEKSGRQNFEIKSKEIKRFAREHYNSHTKARWNGRQIRNAFQTAIAMAEYQARKGDQKDSESYGSDPTIKVTLGHEQFETIAETVRDFDAYMFETMGATYQEQAKNEGMRVSKTVNSGKRSKENGKPAKKPQKGSKSSKKSKKAETDSEDDSEEEETMPQPQDESTDTESDT